ncbi:MAG TPA: NB-ARC domain-containing protein, partial [Acidimicrobiales bacterium]|nr:NB-ARC domain-containing protein [Acidimicrobiales bacterium]
MARTPNNLPVALTAFIGRRSELDRLHDLLRSHRLVTVMGSAGCGKSRIAFQAAADAATDFQDGVWVVEMAAVTEPALVAKTVAETLGVSQLPGLGDAESVAAALGDRRVLLVLDNCEHVAPAVAELCGVLLRSAPGLRVLATSRQTLHAEGETAWGLPSLSLPAPGATDLDEYAGSDAVALFVDRARLVQPDFALDAVSAKAVGALCRRLDGIPLAIELAAARVRVLGVEDLLVRLDDRFAVLVSSG